MRLRNLGHDFLAWVFPGRFVARGTRIAPHPETPEEIAQAKREYLDHCA